MPIRNLVFAVFMIVGALNANAETMGVPSKGLSIARDRCATCHQVEASQTLITNQAANFRAIANTDGMTGYALSVWFRTSHRNMPNLILSTEEQRHLIAYITSLRDRE